MPWMSLTKYSHTGSVTLVLALAYPDSSSCLCCIVVFFSRMRRRAAHQYIKKKEKGGKEPPKQKCYWDKGSVTHPRKNILS